VGKASYWKGAYQNAVFDLLVDVSMKTDLV